MKLFITVDLGFGDSGKGTIVDALVRRYNAGLIVRFNGGSQAAHSVYSKAGTHHAFSQFGSTFQPVYTLLSRYMLVNPLILEREANVLRQKGFDDVLSQVFIDERATMVTPFHRAINRLRELARGGLRHGSCGAGIGETMAHKLAEPNWAIKIGDLHNPILFQNKLGMVREHMRQEMVKLQPLLPNCLETQRQLSTFDYNMNALWKLYETFYYKVRERIVDEHRVLSILTHSGPVVFEAAQGVLLDENYGFHPHTTWSTTTTKNARLILEEAEITEKPTTIGIVRSYTTRHGAGPFPTESAKLTKDFADANNPDNPWQQTLRSGALDLPLLRYANKVTGHVDLLAVTHMDRFKANIEMPVCLRYEEGELPVPTSIKEQQSLGDWLHTVTPVYDSVSSEMLLSLLRNQIAPIGVTSATPGPDKLFEGFHLPVDAAK